MQAIAQVNLDFPKVRSGKVREVFDAGENLLLVATDRISAFDVILPTAIPAKGVVLNRLSKFWFEKCSDIVPNHVVIDDSKILVERLGLGREVAMRSMLVKKADPIPFECVVRRYLLGSLLKDYNEHGPNVHGLDLPSGLKKGHKFDKPIFTPATKATSGHDVSISFDQMVESLGEDIAGQLRDISLTLFERGSSIAKDAGFILADTKFEFGVCKGKIMLIDELFTPDSSRFWDEGDKDKADPPSFDKQFVRDYLETLDWNKAAPGPDLPAEIVKATQDRYYEVLKRLTGIDLKA